MALLNEQIRKEVRSALADVANPVTFKVFTQAFECQYCKETRELIEEVASLSDKLSVEVYDFEKDKALERRFQPVMVNEPDTLDAISILRGLKERYESYHHVRIKDEAIIAAVELSQRYITCLLYTSPSPRD